ncbi:serine hydrolase domain-containing protein [Pseudomonas sp. 1152_12]|uniref:serine hydrolase domain-containing protein n=1 Tax=Pseudomonas sp. 1152_12 TaxID=2604455 RepID=UPI004063EAF7
MFRTITASILMMSSSLAAAVDAAALSREQSVAVDRYVAAEMARQGLPGLALGIYRNGRIVLAKGYGLANVELNVPMSADSVLQSGSVGKSFTATAVMMLVEQGKVRLDDSITQYFPEAPAGWLPIKVANLLSHTSGLPAYDTPELQKPRGPLDIRRDFSEAELAAALATLPLDFKAGDNWAYENSNFLLLGILIHRVSGQPYGEFLQQHVFTPLGMSASRVISDLDIVPNRVSGYEKVDGVLKNQEWVSPTFNATADGTLYFTVRDIARWDRALYGETLLKKASLQTMWTPYPYAGKQRAEGYGFGWEIRSINGQRVVEHGGSWQGFTSHISRFIDDKLTVVVLTNLDAEHSYPEVIVRGVAGLIEPELK